MRFASSHLYKVLTNKLGDDVAGGMYGDHWPMHPRRRFQLYLTIALAAAFGYGLRRFSLGVDFTDEGAYLAWPLRVRFGERPFAGDPLILLRPIFNQLAVLSRIYPDISLYDFRLLGWVIHLGAYATLAGYLFRLCGGPLLSIALAGVPLFVCHIFGLASPSYNSISSDFFLVALSLRGLALLDETTRKSAVNLAGGLALFVASLAHTGLGAIAAAMLVWECWRHDLVRNLLRRRPSPSNLFMLIFVAGWIGYAGVVLATGGGSAWLERYALFRTFAPPPMKGDATAFLLALLRGPFLFSPWALGFSAAAVVAAGAAWLLARAQRLAAAMMASGAFAVIVALSLVQTYFDQPDSVPLGFAQVSLLLTAALALGMLDQVRVVALEEKFLLVTAAAAGWMYAIVTYYFSPLRSWTSGILALAFPFSFGLALLLRPVSERLAAGLRRATIGLIGAAIACAAQQHYRSIYRDETPAKLTATFRLPKLRHVRSTPERTAAVDTLYDYLHPKLTRGEPLLAFDDCPMLYYLFDARPVYGLTWATRYTQSRASLAQMDRELRAGPLPRYAIRTLVDLSNPAWEPARRTRYDYYPLNETVTSLYELDRTIFPFEIWHLKADAGK